MLGSWKHEFREAELFFSEGELKSRSVNYSLNQGSINGPVNWDGDALDRSKVHGIRSFGDLLNYCDVTDDYCLGAMY